MEEIHTEVVNVDDLVQDNHNFNAGTEKGTELLERSFKDYGAGRSVFIDKNNTLERDAQQIINKFRVASSNVCYPFFLLNC